MRNRMDVHVAGAFVVCALVAGGVGVFVGAGPLNPPAGAVAGTYKTLTEVEPRIAVNATNTPGDGGASPSLFRISQPGSYYLTGNITVGSGVHGIEIDTSNVTLDLMGFRILGSLGSLDGIHVEGTETNLTIRNGSVRSMGGNGLESLNGDSVRVVDFTARNCTGHGVSLGWGCTASNVIADSNSGDGIVALGALSMSLCTSRENGGSGIDCGSGGAIVSSTAASNTGDGFNLGSGCTVTACVAHDNGGDGFGILNSGTFTGCQAFSNTLDGIDAAGGGSNITGCTVKSNGGYGVRASTGCTVVQCAASLNALSGIYGGSSSLIADCTSSANDIDGVRVVSNCTVRGNVCEGNGVSGAGGGVRALSDDNRIEGNTCVGNDTGVDVDVGGNIILRNSCSGNTTNWVIAASNRCLVILGLPAPAINGDTGGTSSGSSEPNANFTY